MPPPHGHRLERVTSAWPPLGLRTFKGSLEGSIEDITIEISEWIEDGKPRYHIRAHDQHGKQSFGTNPYDSLETAILLFPWHELERQGDDS